MSIQNQPKHFPQKHRTLLLAIIVLTITACTKTRHLMPTPDIYAGNNSAGFEIIDLPLQTNSINLLYVTDRKPEHDEDDVFGYGFLRSRSMAFGSVEVIPGFWLSRGYSRSRYELESISCRKSDNYPIPGD